MQRTTKRSGATIYTLAELAGVSPATVSRALNGDPMINIKTRGEIHKLARAQGYRKSVQAANLSKGRAGVIAMLLPTIANPIYTHLAARLIELAQAKGFHVDLSYSELDPERELRTLREFLDTPSDGFIIAPEHGEACRSALAKLAARGKPIVLRQNVEFEHGFDAVFVDFERGAEEATRHLIDLGHRDIRSVGMVGDKRRGKTAGFLRAMREAGLAPSAANLVACAPSMEKAYQACLKTFQHSRPSALLIHSDYLAFGALRALAELGLKVPQDVSVVSMDDIEFAAYGPCPLTTMAQPVDAQAETLLAALLRQLEQPNSPKERTHLQLRLVDRGSTRMAAS